jgi:hypothetical protein
MNPPTYLAGLGASRQYTIADLTKRLAQVPSITILRTGSATVLFTSTPQAMGHARRKVGRVGVIGREVRFTTPETGMREQMRAERLKEYLKNRK